MAVNRNLDINVNIQSQSASRNIQRVNSEFTNLAQTSRNTSNNTSQLNTNINNTNSLISNAIPLVSRLTAVLIGLFSVSKILESFTEFESKMRNVNSIMLETEDNFAKTSNQVLKLAESLRLSTPQNLANALYQIESSGFAGSNAMKILEATAKSSAAGGIKNLDTAVTGLTATLNGLGLEAEEVDRVSAVMFKTIQLGVVNFEQISSGIGKVISTAKQLKCHLKK